MTFFAKKPGWRWVKDMQAPLIKSRRNPSLSIGWLDSRFRWNDDASIGFPRKDSDLEPRSFVFKDIPGSFDEFLLLGLQPTVFLSGG